MCRWVFLSGFFVDLYAETRKIISVYKAVISVLRHVFKYFMQRFIRVVAFTLLKEVISSHFRNACLLALILLL